MRVFLHVQQRGLKLHPDLAQLIRNQLSLVDNAFLRDPHVRETFLEILDHRGNVAPVLRAMHEVGFLGKFLPEFGRLTCLVQHEFYHQYTADEHTLFCIDKLDQVWNAKTPPFSGYAEMFRSIETPFILYLALLLHDAGKAFRTGHHEQIGGKVALSVSRRLGLDGAKTHMLRLIIENHLTMAQISQRRDLDDPSVINSLARQIQTPKIWSSDAAHLCGFDGNERPALERFQGRGPVAALRENAPYVDRRHRISSGRGAPAGIAGRGSPAPGPATLLTRRKSRPISTTCPPRYLQISDAREILRDVTHVHRFIRLQLSEARRTP